MALVSRASGSIVSASLNLHLCFHHQRTLRNWTSPALSQPRPLVSYLPTMALAQRRTRLLLALTSSQNHLAGILSSTN